MSHPEPSEQPSRHQAILSLSLPIIAGMLSQNVVNVVDTAMVGRVGTTALASVGLGSFLNFFFAAFVMGIAVGVQTLCARWRGAGREDYAVPLNGGLTLALAIGAPLYLIFSWSTDWFMALASDDPEVARGGAGYLQARLIGLVAIGVNFAFRSYWSAVERASLYFITIITMHVTNITLNWLLIFGNLGFPELGVVGAGLGTGLSMWVGVIIHLGLALRFARPYGFLARLPSRADWRTLLSMALPSGVERTLFALGMTIFMSLIGRISAEALAASNVILNLFLVAILPAMGFGIASATFVSRSIGAGAPSEALAWQRAVAHWALGALTLIALPFGFASAWIAGSFTTDVGTAQMISETLWLMALILPMEASHMVIYQSLLGLGDNRFVMGITLTAQWLVSLPLVYLIAVTWGWGVWWAWALHFMIRGGQCLSYHIRWRHRLTQLIERAEGQEIDLRSSEV